jgi:beta-glucosidase
VDCTVEDDDASLAHAVADAAAADLAVVVVGTSEEVESEGFDRTSLALPGRQDELVHRVAAARPETVVVVNAGAPVLMPWRDEVAATLLAWFPGQEFGGALADVLCGRTEPGGRLPTTWPAEEGAVLPSTTPVDGRLDYTEGIHIGYRRFLRDGVEPAYWFGHGLGYTTWSYDALDVTPETSAVAVTVTNTGQRTGRELVQVYLARPESSIERPVRWLAGYAWVQADPGESVTVEVALPPRAFEHWDADAHTWIREPGAFTVAVGPSAGDIALRAELA